MSTNPPSSGELDAARLLLDRLGVTAEQLLSTPGPEVAMPTFDTFIDRASAAISVGALKVYQPYFKKIRKEWGQRLIDEPTGLEIQRFAEQARSQAVVRRNARGGRVAGEHMIGAFRCLYRLAVADELIDENKNPAAKAVKPRRLSNSRRALLDHQLMQINEIAVTTGNDHDLDGLLIRLHVETACRRGGALSMRRYDLDPDQCLVRLREKDETERWQPISPTLMRHLLAHWQQRGDGDPHSTGQLLRYRHGRPISYRRYDHLWKRIGENLPWVTAQQVSTHWLRYTTLTWVERAFGYAVARAYAGHNNRADNGSTATYVRAELYEVVLALTVLTGEPHPLLPVEHAVALTR
ncbi:site-specific integrase [Micromonospora sp. NPDC049107]|uniref:tyrosine-type recombinase/integrase n=1 Tax=unclassified Micromonospora TaxID=2617518 RepID=UPI0033D9DBD4